MKRIKKIKGWAVVMSSAPFHPADWFGCYSIFRRKCDAKYWLKTRVNQNSHPTARVVETEIIIDLR